MGAMVIVWSFVFWVPMVDRGLFVAGTAAAVRLVRVAGAVGAVVVGVGDSWMVDA